MPKTKEQKQKIIEDLIQKFQNQKGTVLVNFSGLDSQFLSNLREELKALNGCFLVVKKTLLKKVLEGLKEKELQEKIEALEGRLALAFGFGDEIVPAKICYQFSKENENLEILGGILEKQFIEREKVIELAQLPSREELLARFIGSLQNPISGFCNVLQGNLRNLVFILSQIKVIQ